jgi:hypothetical protein
MKKIKFVFISIVVAAALYFCFSAAYANYQIHKSFTDEMSYFDRFGIKYELIEQQRGLFSSVYKTKFSMVISNGTVLSVTMENKAEFGIRDFDILKIGVVHSSYDYDDYIKSFWGKRDVVNNITMDIRFNGIEASIKTKPENFETAINYNDEQLTSNYSSGSVTQYIKSSFDSKAFVVKYSIEDIVNSVGELVLTDMKNLTFDIDVSRNELNTWMGEIKLGAKNYNIIRQGNIGIFDTYVTNYMVTIAANEQDGGLMSVNFQNGADEIKFLSDELNITIKDILLDITISHLEQNSINAIANRLSKINLAMRDSEKQVILASAVSDAMSLLKTHPTIDFNFAGSFNGSKVNQISGYIKYIGDSVYGINLFNWQNYFDFELKYAIDKNMLMTFLQDKAIEKYKKAELSSEKTEALIEKETQDVFDKLQILGADINAEIITGTFNKNTASLL